MSLTGKSNPESFRGNGAEAWTRPATIPDRSDLVLVNSTEYNARGEMSATTDPNGIVTGQEYDDSGRMMTKIENHGTHGTHGMDSVSVSSVSSVVPSSGRVTAFTYNTDGKLLTLTARNSVTGDQVTRFVYGTTLEDSGVASNGLLRAKIYPDSDDGEGGSRPPGLDAMRGQALVFD
jgi:YD repeat-containing protein